MDINYTVKSPKCHESADGSICIQSISLTSEEMKTYGKYSIEWTENVKAYSKSKKIAGNLKSGSYGFRLYGNGHYSDWNYIEILAPEPLIVKEVNIQNNPCALVASLTVTIEGGTAPYTVYYGTKTIVSDSRNIVIDNIQTDMDSRVMVRDSNNCVSKYPEPIKIKFSNIFFRIVNSSPPAVHDDHAQDFTIEVFGGEGPYKFILYEVTEDNTKGNKISETDILDSSLITNVSNNIFTYNLSKLFYPGLYILDIIDSNGCVFTTNSISIRNIRPLSAMINVSDNSVADNIFIAKTEIIYDTILFPISLVINDKNIKSFIKNLDIGSPINVNIGDKKYTQKIFAFNKNVENYDNDLIDILCLKEDPDYWYCSISIARGFNLSDDPEILSENINIEIEGNTYTTSIDFPGNSSDIKLIRAGILTSNHNTNQFNNSNSIVAYQETDGEFETICECPLFSAKKTNNVYGVGQLFLINVIDNTKINFITNLNDIVQNLNDDNLQDMRAVYDLLVALNDQSKNVFVSAKNTIPYNGNISLMLIGGHSNHYDIKYYKYIDNKLHNIYYNNSMAKNNHIGQLSPGIYIIKVSDDYGNILKNVNDQSYEDYYDNSLKIIQEYVDNPDSLDYQYGDLLVHLQNLDITQNPRIEVLSNTENFTPEIIVDTNNVYNNKIHITSLTDILCQITGPNSFNHSFKNNLILKNLPPGVYKIVGDKKELKDNYLYDKTFQVFVSKNSIDYIDLKFNSYCNQFIIKE